MTAPRLLPDYAALPTATDRRLTREAWQARQTSLLDPDAGLPPVYPCPACAGDHPAGACGNIPLRLVEVDR